MDALAGPLCVAERLGDGLGRGDSELYAVDDPDRLSHGERLGDAEPDAERDRVAVGERVAVADGPRDAVAHAHAQPDGPSGVAEQQRAADPDALVNALSLTGAAERPDGVRCGDADVVAERVGGGDGDGNGERHASRLPHSDCERHLHHPSCSAERQPVGYAELVSYGVGVRVGVSLAERQRFEERRADAAG